MGPRLFPSPAKMDDVALQIALGLLLLLTISTLNFSAQSNLPKVSYVKALDVWFLGEPHIFASFPPPANDF